MIKHMYPQHVVAIFEKELSANANDGLSFETRLADEWGNDDATSVCCEINDLIHREDTSEWWLTHQPNAIKLLKGKKLKLVMEYGLTDWASKDSKQEISFSANKEDAFIFWRIDELEFLNGVANAMKGEGKVWVKIDMFCDDALFDGFQNDSSYRVNLYKISINFSKE